MDPIALVVALGGETATLKSPATTAVYNPSAGGDYAPNAPASLAVRGVPEKKIEHVAGAEGAFTFSATSLPTNLKAKGTKLNWRGRDWTVLKWRERTWLGQINGYTLYLGI